MPDQQTLELWISMLETAQRVRIEKGLERDPAIQEQLDIWRTDLEKEFGVKRK